LETCVDLILQGKSIRAAAELSNETTYQVRKKYNEYLRRRSIERGNEREERYEALLQNFEETLGTVDRAIEACEADEKWESLARLVGAKNTLLNNLVKHGFTESSGNRVSIAGSDTEIIVACFEEACNQASVSSTQAAELARVFTSLIQSRTAA
jgi:translation initiation factor 2 alpha subunit (eIF-2alpha)